MKFVVNSVQTRNLTLHTIRHALVVLRMFQYHFLSSFSVSLFRKPQVTFLMPETIFLLR